MRIVVVGDVVLDVDVRGRAERLCPDGPGPVVDELERVERPGGAGLAATMLAMDGHDVTILTAIGPDGAGGSVREALARTGVRTVDLGGSSGTAVKRRLRVGATTVARWDTGPDGDGARRQDGRSGPVEGAGHGDDDRMARQSLGAEAVVALRRAGAVLVSDYGSGLCGRRELRSVLGRVGVPVVWDPHPRGSEPVPGVVVVPNEREAGVAEGSGVAEVAAAARSLVARWSAAGVVVTRSERGALVTAGPGAPAVVPVPVSVGDGAPDMCGAGDRFATALVERLGAGVPLTGAATVAVERAASFVRGGGVQGLVPGPPLDVPVAADDARTVPPALVSRDRGLRVVAAGGCFDLLHAGHVRLLEVARSMGDVLVVCLNSDASVRRLKGPGRPIVGERDRRRVLVGLASVDHVVVFDEPTPARVLDSLRPDVFVKGSDYFGRDLPESGQLARWGGEVVTVPLLPGRSTSGLVSTVLEDAATA